MGFPNPLLEPLKDLIVYNRRKIYIDNPVFRMHYVWTVFLLITSSIFVSSKIYIGNPISCIASKEIKEIANEYCYIHSTFTRGKFEKGKWTYEPVKENEIYPGVRPDTKDQEDVPHSYYQWVWCVLLVQAAMFYFPHWAWEKLEGGRVMMLVGNLNLPMLADDKKHKHRQKILWYFDPNRGFHQKYAMWHAIMEFANLINIIVQICITDYFLNYEFSAYGFQLFRLSQTRPYRRDDALARVFPTITACRLQTGGVGFGKNQHDLLCVLPINIVNEKIYIILWFWFLIVAVASVGAIVFRVATLMSARLRKKLLWTQTRFVEKDVVKTISVDSKYGDWFLIHKLGQNMDSVTFGDLIKDIADAFNHGGTPKGIRIKERRLSFRPEPSPCTTPLMEKILDKFV